MADFASAVRKVLKVEGGYQNNPDDLGNYNAYDSNGNFVPYKERKGQTLRAGTNRGISAGLFSGILKREVSLEEIQAISEAQAIEIYRKVFWNGIRGDQIKDQQLAELIFDGHVNHGPTGILLLQRVLNRLGAKLKEDYKFGPLTFKATNQVSAATLYNGLIEARRQFYHQLVKKDPSQETFLQGWLNRLKKFPPMIEKVNGAQMGIAAGIIGLLWVISD